MSHIVGVYSASAYCITSKEHAPPKQHIQHIQSLLVIQVKLRKNGGTAGTWDAYYIAPEGKRFRSRKEVAVFLGLIPGSDQKRRSSNTGDAPENPWTIADRSAQPTRNAAVSAAARIAGSMHDTAEGAAAAATAALEAALASTSLFINLLCIAVTGLRLQVAIRCSCASIRTCGDFYSHSEHSQGHSALSTI